MRTLIRERLIATVVGLILGLWVVYGCSRAEGATPGNVNIIVEWAPGDTARIIGAWGVVQGSFPIADFTTRLVNAQDQEVTSGTAPATQRADTLLLPDLLPGETYGPYTFGVVATDDRGNAGPEARSEEFTVSRGFTPPGVTDVEVTIDTTSLALERQGFREDSLALVDGFGTALLHYEIVGEGGYLLACERVLLVESPDVIDVAGRQGCGEPLTFAYLLDPETGERLNPVQLLSEVTYAVRPVQ